ncbi:hypothetical protein PYW08_002037 [Mythimna loreyi]|uniref:Uncharacterized protein n=1 Tax=Mythimna loreyi TaxID=667449 RepID=A0ACC2R305_9NEOP|nr:hypothetical protein PYW08_002037 [Mythimna loreyi]
MNNQQEVVDQVVQNLAFEVEAVPKYEPIQTKSVSQITPLNMKIKVRKKDDIFMQRDVSSIADNASRTVQKVRLVNSEQTIMTFDVFMEAEFEKKPPRKLRKHIFDLLRPGICLGAVDDDERPYIPSTSYSANITEPSVVTKSNGTLKQTFTLSKNVFEAYSVSTQPGVQKWLFGNCKPGGCLDPPFNEDKYSYKPSIRQGPEREENIEAEKNKSDVDNNKKPIMQRDEETQSNGRHSSIFDSGIFKKKRKSSDKCTNTNLLDKTDSIVDVFPASSSTNSVSTHSNPIITYPPKTKGSNSRISDDKTVRSRDPSEEKPRRSFNDHSESYYVPPKGVQRMKENVALDPNDQPKRKSSDAAGVKDLHKESFKVPVLLPIPVPVPISIDSSKRKPEVIATNDDIIKKDLIPNQDIQDQELQGTINLKDIKLSPLVSLSNSEDGGTEPVVNLPIGTLVPSIIKKPTVPNEIDDQKSDETKLQSLEAKYNENNIEDSAPQNLKKITSSSEVPVSVPVLFPPKFSDPNRTDTDATDSIKNYNIDSDTKLSDSKKSFEIKTMPSAIKDAPFEGSKDIEQNIKPESGENETFSHAIPENILRTGHNFSDQESDTEIPIDLNIKRDPKAEINAMTENFLRTGGNVSDQESDSKMLTDSNMKQESNAEIDAKPENILRTRGDLSDQESETGTLINLDMVRDSKGKQNSDEVKKTSKQNGNANKATLYTKEPMQSAEITNGIVNPSEKNDKKEDIKRDIEDNKITDGIEKLTKQSGTEDKTLIPTKYTDDNIKPYFEDDKPIVEDFLTKYADKDVKRNSKEETITDNIEKLTKQKNSQDEPTSDTKYTESSSDVFGMPNTHQNIDSSKKDEQKDSQRTLSKLPILQDNTSLLNANNTSAKYKTKRSDTPDHYSDNVEYRDNDFGTQIDKKQLPLSSNLDYEADIRDGKVSEPFRNQEYIGETAKPNNDDKIDSYIDTKKRHTNGERTNIIAAPVTVDNTEETPILRSIKEVYNEKKIVNEPTVPNFKKFDDDGDAHSTVSHELIGTKSVIYNTDGSSTSAENVAGDISLSAIQSANILKSAMKKDTIFIDFRFHSYLNDKNERIVQTVDSAKAPKRLSSDSVTVIKSQIRISSNEIRIPVDSEHDIFIKIKKANANQRVSISESTLVNDNDTERANKQRSPVQCSDVGTKNAEVFTSSTGGRKDKIQESETADRFLDYYEQELVPLQLIIKNLREEIDYLATQQSIFKDKLYCPNKSKLPRLIHSNKKCFGCVRK